MCDWMNERTIEWKKQWTSWSTSQSITNFISLCFTSRTISLESSLPVLLTCFATSWGTFPSLPTKTIKYQLKCHFSESPIWWNVNSWFWIALLLFVLASEHSLKPFAELLLQAATVAGTRDTEMTKSQSLPWEPLALGVYPACPLRSLRHPWLWTEVYPSLSLHTAPSTKSGQTDAPTFIHWVNGHMRCAAFEILALVDLKCGRRTASWLASVLGKGWCVSGGVSGDGLAWGQGQMDLF